ncbi:hypothetical protein SANTM175S_08231 [Streptomyces antimycoticus]
MRGGGVSAARRAVAWASAAAIVAVSLVLLPVATAGALPVAQAMSASERAAASGEPVEVTAQRAEYSQTFANPDGTFTLEQSSVPQRVRADDGSWRDVDTTLERRSDGSVGPRSAVVDLAFSGGGDAEDLLRLGRAGKSIRLSWPGRQVPAPRLDGATATYPDVLDGVDLQLTATAEGYRQVLVVRTAQAATNPDLEQIKLSVSGVGLEAAPGAGGGLRAMDDDGNAVFKGPAGQMWDSAGGAEGLAADGPKAPKARVTTAPDERGPQTRPGDGDASAVLPVTVQDGALIVKPDLGLLRGDKTVYPVYIDPPVGLGASERTKLSSDGDRFWQFDGSLGVGKCGSASGYYCGAGYVDRMYFEFAPSKLVGKYVLDATFRAHETWSFDCDPHWVDLERTDNISEGTRWPGPRQLDQMGDRYVSAGRGKNCSPEQPDAWIEFNDNPDESDENLASTVRSFADGKISRLTLMLRAKDESDATAWKRFEDNATLKVTYVPRPGVPTSVGVIPGDGTSGYCKTSSSDPLVVTRKDPMVQARVQTRTQPKSGEDKGSLQAEFWMERKQGDGAWDKVWSGYRPDSGWDPDGTLEKMRTTDRADGGLYRYKARTQSHWAYSGKSGDLFSSYSSWCYLKIDSTAPKAPQITAGKPYTECLPNQCVGMGGPGVSGTFSVKPNAADTDITGYRWRLLTTTAANTKQSAGARITLNVTPPLSGTQVLSVEAKDVRNRWGTPAEFTFAVASAAGPVGRWHFADGAPGSGVTKAVDSATEGTRHDATLYDEAGTGWSTFGRRGDADYSLWLNDSSTTSGYAATSAAAVNTQDSFTVSTWAYLTDATENRVVLTEPGEDGSGFTLYYWPPRTRSGSSTVRTRTATTPHTSAHLRREVARRGEGPPLRVCRLPSLADGDYQGRHRHVERHRPRGSRVGPAATKDVPCWCMSKAAAGPAAVDCRSVGPAVSAGRTANTNNQGSWIGEGFDLTSSYIERKYGSCNDDGQDDKFDLCWKYDNASLVLNGKATELVKDDTSGTWRLKNDDASTVTALHRCRQRRRQRRVLDGHHGRRHHVRLRTQQAGRRGRGRPHGVGLDRAGLRRRRRRARLLLGLVLRRAGQEAGMALEPRLRRGHRQQRHDVLVQRRAQQLRQERQRRSRHRLHTRRLSQGDPLRAARRCSVLRDPLCLEQGHVHRRGTLHGLRHRLRLAERGPP